jgi:hypothetical protein
MATDRGNTTPLSASYDVVNSISNFTHLSNMGSSTSISSGIYDVVASISNFIHIANKGLTVQQSDLQYYDVITNYGNNIIPGTGPSMHWTS